MATQLQSRPEEAFPKTKELKSHNHLLGNKAALDQAWETDGYWFFRGVLDTEAVARLRKSWIDVLETEGVIDPVGDAPTDRSVKYNGGSLDTYPKRMEPIQATRPWTAFVADKPIDDFFRDLFQDEPFWVPIVEYRATPPQTDRSASRIDAIHQDGPFSPGIPFRICWIPLAEIDADTGGLMLAEGMAGEKQSFHPTLENGSVGLIPLDAIPADRWRRTTYQAGDVLLMNLWTPHTGLTNHSDRFRLSMDHRVMARGDKCPIVGTIIHISESHVTVRDRDTNIDRTLMIDPATYVRNDWGQKLSGHEITEFHAIGKEVIIAYDGEHASVVRPTH